MVGEKWESQNEFGISGRFGNMLFEYPTKKDIERIAKSFDVQKLNVQVEDFPLNGDSIDAFSRSIELETWVNHLQNRIYDVWKSYVLLTYYFEMGIPDDEWHISPGKHGESVQYYPNFEEKHFKIKSEFDYYVDVFYYKIFSAWDTVGHVLNVMHNLKIKKPSFRSVVEKLKSANINFCKVLNTIVKHPDFEKAKELRNNITHNYLPSSIDAGIGRESESKISFGVGSYTTSKEFYENILNSLDLFAMTLNSIKHKSKAAAREFSPHNTAI